MKLMNVRVWSAAAAAVILGTVAGCSSASSAGNIGAGTTMPVVASLETTNLTVYDFPAIDSAGLYIAENDGFFKAEGLHVTVVPDYTSSQDTVNMI